MYKSPLEDLTGNFPVWSEAECNGSVENIIEHMTSVHGSETGERSVSGFFIVTLGVEGLFELLLLGLDYLALWL